MRYEATYKITTPMFLAGAEQENSGTSSSFI